MLACRHNLSCMAVQLLSSCPKSRQHNPRMMRMLALLQGLLLLMVLELEMVGVL